MSKLLLIFLISFSFQLNSIETHFDFDDPPYDEDSLDMFPKPKLNCDLNRVDKNEFCKDTCETLKDALCADYLVKFNEQQQQSQEKNSKKIYTVDGVFSYYKNFVHKFLEQIQVEKLLESTESPINIKQFVKLTSYDLKKLIEFSKYETKIWNSSIQDVTDILKGMILDTESYTPDSKFNVIMDRFELYTGLSIKSIFIAIVTTIASFAMLFVTLRMGILRNMNTRKFLALLLITGFALSAINNYFYLSQKKELLRKAHLASYVPSECFEATNKNAKESQGLFNAIRNYFKTSPTSKICLDYSEAIMIDSFIKVNFMEVLSYTVIQTIRPVFISTGEFVNEFYVGLSKDLNMFQAAIASAFVSFFGLLLIGLLTIIFCCHEISLFHIFTIKKSTDNRSPINEAELRKRLTNEIITQLAVELPSEMNSLKKIENPSVDDLRQSVKLYIKTKEDEMKANKECELKDMLEDILQKSVINRTSEIKSISYTETNPKIVEPVIQPFDTTTTKPVVENIKSKFEFEDMDYVLDDEY